MRRRRRGALFDFGPAVGNDGSEEAKGNGTHQDGPSLRVLRECVLSEDSGYTPYAPWLYAVCPLPTRGSFFFSAPVATNPALPLSLKKFVG